MTDQQIIDGNKLIAYFMGARWMHDGCYFKFNDHHLGYGWVAESEDLFYHIKWDWLISVVESIERLGFEFEIRRLTVEIRTFEEESQILFLIHSKSKIEAVYSAVIQFILWYNQQKQ